MISGSRSGRTSSVIVAASDAPASDSSCTAPPSAAGEAGSSLPQAAKMTVAANATANRRTVDMTVIGVPSNRCPTG